MDDKYHITVIRKGVMYDAYLFKSWTSYAHPVRPRDPITYIESQERQGYGVVLFGKGATKDLIIEFTAVQLERRPLDTQPAVFSPSGFYRARVSNGHVEAVDPVPLEATVDLDQYVRHTVSSGGDPKYQVVTKKLAYSFLYTYREGAALARVAIRKPGSESVLEY